MMTDGNLERAREILSAWTRRPPGRSATVARTRVLARLEEAGDRPRFLLAAATSAVLCLTIALLIVVPRWPSDGSRAIPVVRSIGSGESMLVYELSSGTTLYFTLAEMSATKPAEPGNTGGEG
jgi:hypothetical protein